MSHDDIFFDDDLYCIMCDPLGNTIYGNGEVVDEATLPKNGWYEITEDDNNQLDDDTANRSHVINDWMDDVMYDPDDE